MTTMRHDFPASVVEDPAVHGADRHEFPLGPQPELLIVAGSGDVTVHAADTSAVSVRGLGDPLRAAKALRVSHEANRVRIHVRGSHDYLVVAPRDCRVRVHTSSGDVRVEGTAATTVETSSGDITVEGIAGDCDLSASSGEISGRRLTGHLSARSSSGDVEIRESRLQGFELRSSSGKITVETPLLVGARYVCNTSSGDLRLFVPPGTAASLHLHSGSGRLECALPADIVRPSRRQWEARLNGGGVRMEMHSSSGSLHVLEGWSPTRQDTATGAHEGPVASPETHPYTSDAPSLEPAPQAGAETTAILGMLERGEISVEEAMSRLDALD